MNTLKIRSLLIIAGLLVASGLIWIAGSSNIETPAGYVTYVRQGSLFGQARFITTQTGPTSSGLHWLYKGQNISVTPYTQDELWGAGDGVLAKDKLNIILSAHLTWRIRPDRVRDFMEHYGGWDEHGGPDELEKEAYKQFIRQPFRNFVREGISEYAGLDINDNLRLITEGIRMSLTERFKDTPFEIISAVVGTCVPPSTVVDQIARKVAARQELERKVTELEIAQKQEGIKTAEGKALAAQEVEEAKGKALAIASIKKELTHEYLTYQAIQAMSGASRIYVPMGNNGLPLVGNFDLEPQTKKP